MIDLIYPPDYEAPLLPSPTAYTASVRKECPEMFPVIRPDGIVIGKAERDFCHNGSHLLHPVVHLHLIDRQERIYLQKRSSTKKLLPGYWDTSVGGHVIYGEGVMEALMRESSEELGLVAFNPVYLCSYVWETEVDSEFVNVFAAVGNFTPKPDKNEVDEGCWWNMSELNSPPSCVKITNNFLYEYEMIRDKLLSML